jgi:hypothetical protein
MTINKSDKRIRENEALRIRIEEQLAKRCIPCDVAMCDCCSCTCSENGVISVYELRDIIKNTP